MIVEFDTDDIEIYALLDKVMIVASGPEQDDNDDNPMVQSESQTHVYCNT